MFKLMRSLASGAVGQIVRSEIHGAQEAPTSTLRGVSWCRFKLVLVSRGKKWEFV